MATVRPHVVFLDLVMPRISGLTVASGLSLGRPGTKPDAEPCRWGNSPIFLSRWSGIDIAVFLPNVASQSTDAREEKR